MNTMENTVPQGPDNSTEHKGIMEIVRELQTHEKELTSLKAHQERLRATPERAEKNSLLGEIEGKIRNTINTISELQDRKMELIKKGDEKYAPGGDMSSANDTLPPGSTVEEDPFKEDPQSLGSWRQLNK